MVSAVDSDPWSQANRTRGSKGSRAGATDERKGKTDENDDAQVSCQSNEAPLR